MQFLFVGHPLTSSFIFSSFANLLTLIYLTMRYLSMLFISF
nr:MAG TPA: hypothetical protein [Caudoviricetes sp.]